MGVMQRMKDGCLVEETVKRMESWLSGTSSLQHGKKTQDSVGDTDEGVLRGMVSSVHSVKSETTL